MIALRTFGPDDVSFLMTHYKPGIPKEEAQALIYEWSQKSYNGSYFEMSVILDGTQPVGWISLYAHEKATVSAGMEIIEGQRKKGFAYQALGLALEKARALGYQTANAQVRKHNAASIRLHEKSGYTRCGEGLTSKGGDAYIYELKL